MTYFKHSSWKLSTPLPAAAAPTRPAPSACAAPCCSQLLCYGCRSPTNSLSPLNRNTSSCGAGGGILGVVAVGSGGPFGAVPVLELHIPVAVWLLDVGSVRFLRRPRPVEGLSKGKMRAAERAGGGGGEGGGRGVETRRVSHQKVAQTEGWR